MRPAEVHLTDIKVPEGGKPFVVPVNCMNRGYISRIVVVQTDGPAGAFKVDVFSQKLAAEYEPPEKTKEKTKEEKKIKDKEALLQELFRTFPQETSSHGVATFSSPFPGTPFVNMDKSQPPQPAIYVKITPHGNEESEFAISLILNDGSSPG